MHTYSLELLELDNSISRIDEKLAESGRANAVKVFIAQMRRALLDAKDCQLQGVHRFVPSGQCSCGLDIQPGEGEPFSVLQERVFRTRGHVDHLSAKLTKLFIRKWPAVNMAGPFYCWWCVECGYQGEAKLSKHGELPRRPLHECRSELYRRDLLRKLRASYVRIAHAHWNNATRQFANQVEFTLDDENEFIEFRQSDELAEMGKPSWYVFCTACNQPVSGLIEHQIDPWMYEYRERHRDTHFGDREISWNEIAGGDYD